MEDGAPLMPEITRHEPAAALYAGADGLAVIRRLAARAGASGARFLALEVGMGQAAEVADVMRTEGFAETETRRDLAGIERVVVGRR